MSIMTLFVLLPISFIASIAGPIPMHVDGVKGPAGSWECPTGYVSVQDAKECKDIALGPCLSKDPKECKIWSNGAKDSRGMARDFGTANQPGCYYDQNNGVLFNTNKGWTGRFNENDDRPICSWNSAAGDYGFVRSGTCEQAGYRSIHSVAECKAAGAHFAITKAHGIVPAEGFTDWREKYTGATDSRPNGCSWHFGSKLAELWPTSGSCDVHGYGGCFCIKTDFRVDGIRKVSGSTECPDFYHRIMDKAACKEVAEGPCLSNRSDECKFWSKWVHSNTWAKNHGDSNQPGCYYDQDHGVLFNTGTGWHGKHNENDDRPICEKDAETFGESEIVRMLRELIKEGKEEILDINEAVKAAMEKVRVATQQQGEALAKEGEANQAKNNANTLKNKALGLFNAAKKELETSKTGLEGEIALFKKVLGLLDALKRGQGLVEENAELVKAFISTEEQLNPQKLDQVIGLVSNLLKVAEQELQDLKDTVTSTKGQWEAAVGVWQKAVGVWEAAVEYRERKDQALSEANGELERSEEHAKHRIPIIEDEIAILENAIKIIKSLL